MTTNDRNQMEKKLGRPLTDKEIVHHIDLDKTNDNIENLYLCADKREYRKIRRSLKALYRELFEDGWMEFDGKRYVVNEKKMQESMRENNLGPAPPPPT